MLLAQCMPTDGLQLANRAECTTFKTGRSQVYYRRNLKYTHSKLGSAVFNIMQYFHN